MIRNAQGSEERAAELGTEFGTELVALARRHAEARRKARRWTWVLAGGVLIMAIWAFVMLMSLP